MPSIRDFIDPGGRMLARRLDQFCATLENLGARLRDTIANVIGETIGFIVRDTALRVLGEVTHYFPASDSFSSRWQNERDLRTRQQYEDDRDYWDDGEDDGSYEPVVEEGPRKAPARLPAALSAGLQAASWWLRRWTGRKRMITTVAVGLLATGAAFFGGPLVVALFGLAHAATHFTSMSGAFETRSFHSTA